MPTMDFPQNIFLVGPMGVGKSTVGRHLATILVKQFIDADHEIERHTGAPVSLIFEIEGQAGFRERESRMLDTLTSQTNIVLATGGGSVLSEINRNILSDRGFVIYLHADTEVLYQRTRRDRNRPLLNKGDRRKTLEDIMVVRDPLYRKVAKLVIETDSRSARIVAKDIIDKLKLLSNENTGA